jgi:hypothetical protein
MPWLLIKLFTATVNLAATGTVSISNATIARVAALPPNRRAGPPFLITGRCTKAALAY